MMRRLAILTAPIAAAVILFAAPSVASAATCSTAPVGGENAPTVDPVAGTVGETGEQGYKCSVAWQAGLFARYESGGTWHIAAGDTPVCAFNWKIELDFYSSNVDGTGLHPVFLATSSAETHKTC